MTLWLLYQRGSSGWVDQTTTISLIDVEFPVFYDRSRLLIYYTNSISGGGGSGCKLPAVLT